MSLRLRIVAAVMLVLGLGSGLGLAVAGQHARHWLRDEMAAAQESGRREAARGIAEMPLSGNPERQLLPLVADFDGDRRLQAWLVTAKGEVLATSRPAPAEPV